MTCHHKRVSFTQATAYAVSLATSFVLNLYLLVPTEVSKLPRSDIRQIKWRIFSVVVTFLIALSTYPFLFHICDEATDDVKAYNLNAFMALLQIDRSVFIPILHFMILYFGSFVTSLLQMKLFYITNGGGATGGRIHEKRFSQFAFHQIVNGIRRPFLNPWHAARDLLIAPLAEEIIFRVCIIPPFVHSGTIGIAKLCWFAPIFFGVAHFHHALNKLKAGGEWKGVMIGALFQTAYTTLFGAYVSYCFVKLGSLPGIVLVHSFCNFMGLPNLALLLQKNNTHMKDAVKKFKIISGVSYLLGIGMFFAGFKRRAGLFPEEGFLRIE